MLKRKSRTKYFLINSFTGIIGQIIIIVSNFVVRTVFIASLGKEYLGITGLFSNILTMLSMTELGLTSVMLYRLYKPLARNDRQEINLLMSFYKKAYRIIGLVVLGLGLLLIPVLPYLVKNYELLAELHINAILIYALYLANSVSSYLFFAYKSTIVRADQKEYIINYVAYATVLLTAVAQIVALKTIGKIEVYVLIIVISSLLQNGIVALIANKNYPYLKSKSEDKLDKKTVREIIKDCTALFYYKLNSVVLKTTDNIVISAFLGLGDVALYSNYCVFYTTIQSLFTRISNGIVHSLGNLHTEENIDHEHIIFQVNNLLSAIMGGVVLTGISVVADEFIVQWIGNNWIIPVPFAFLMGFELYTIAVRTFLGNYRSSMGLFQQAKYRPLIGMILNIIGSIALVNVMGISGVILATIVSDWLTVMWFDPYIIYKHGFKNKYPIVKYFLINGIYILEAIITMLFCRFLCAHIFIGHAWATVCVHIIICAFASPIIMFMLNRPTVEGKYAEKMIRNILSRGFNRK